MINLLPVEKKKQILLEYRMRLGVVVIVAISALTTASLILLIPSYLLSISKYNTATKNLAILEATQGGGLQEKEVNAQIGAMNKKIEFFLRGAGAQPFSPLEIISKILKIKGSTIKIQSFVYSTNTQGRQLVITGKASSRDSLAEFVAALKEEPSFSRVELPISSYVKSSDIGFSLLIENKKK